MEKLLFMRKLLLNSLVIVLIIPMVLSVIVSCENYDLTGEKAMLIGTWKWIYSVKKSNYGGTIEYTTINSSDVSDTYTIEFRDNGKYFFRKNDEVFYKDKAKFLSWEDYVNGGYYFTLFIDDDLNYTCRVNSDTLEALSNYFPPFESLHGYETSSYFVKQ